MLFENAAPVHLAAMVYTQELAASTGGMAPRARMKGIFRMCEKQAWDDKAAKGEPPSPIYDGARGMLVYNSMGGLALALERIEVSHKDHFFQVLRVKDRFTKPAKGWSDVLLNMRFTANQLPEFSFEVQVVHRKMLVLRHDL